MPEDQNVRAEEWNTRLNNFFSHVMKWDQLGVSNTDISDPNREKYSKRGLDSVFAYKRNLHSHQQVIFVEAKTIDDMRSLTYLKIQNWVTTLHEKLENLPAAKKFQDKYLPATDAEYDLGLIGLHVRNNSSYDPSRLMKMLSQVHIPKRKQSRYIGLISNSVFERFYAIDNEVRKFKNSDSCSSINYFIPDYGKLPSADGEVLPLESLFSSFIFCKANMLETTKRQTREPYNANIVFYLGDIHSYNEIRFIGLAIKQFQLLKTHELIIYTLASKTDIRSYIANFKREWTDKSEVQNIEFRQLTPTPMG